MPVLWFLNTRGLWPTKSVICFACLLALDVRHADLTSVLLQIR
jgi:hypothetical protein